MALNYPRLDNASGVWNMKEVTDAVKGGYWPNAGTRGIFGLGQTPLTDTVDYVTIASTGDATDFGDLTSARRGILGAASSFTRGLWGGGADLINIIDYVTISTTGDGVDFGDLTQGRYSIAATSNSTRGCFVGGYAHPSPGETDIIDYVQMASTGNATDFGNLLVVESGGKVAAASPTRGIAAGGAEPAMLNTIEHFEFSTTGNTQDFGDLTVAKGGMSGASSSTRMALAGGRLDPLYTDVVEYIEIASTGNSIDFGTITDSKGYGGGCSNSVRGIFGGGYIRTPSVSRTNIIDYITISSGGTGADFGDLTVARQDCAGISNGHGGLCDGNQGVVDT